MHARRSFQGAREGSRRSGLLPKNFKRRVIRHATPGEESGRNREQRGDGHRGRDLAGRGRGRHVEHKSCEKRVSRDSKDSPDHRCLCSKYCVFNKLY